MVFATGDHLPQDWFSVEYGENPAIFTCCCLCLQPFNNSSGPPHSMHLVGKAITGGHLKSGAISDVLIWEESSLRKKKIIIIKKKT